MVVLFSVVTCLLCIGLGWFMHKTYLRSFAYRTPNRLTMRYARYGRRRPRRAKLTKSLRRIGRKKSLIKKAEHADIFDELLDRYGAF